MTLPPAATLGARGFRRLPLGLGHGALRPRRRGSALRFDTARLGELARQVPKPRRWHLMAERLDSAVLRRGQHRETDLEGRLTPVTVRKGVAVLGDRRRQLA